MSFIVFGLDIGTTKITCVALDIQSHKIIATHTVSNDSEITSSSDKMQGRSEWSVQGIIQKAFQCLRGVMDQLQVPLQSLAGLAITGQQHGVVVVDRQDHTPITPLINWLDRRGKEVFEDTDRTVVEQAIALTGDDAARRTGCRLETGYLGTTLFWMKMNHQLPSSGLACFVSDFLGSLLTGKEPITDPTMAASSGLLDLASRQWDRGMIAALELPDSLFPEIRESGEYLGPLSASAAAATHLPEGLPVFVGLGDNQASFVGSVADKAHSVLVNVGTGSQVTAYTDEFVYSADLQTRPFPLEGYLLVSARSCGGRSYATLASFFNEVGRQIFKVETDPSMLYEIMNRLAQQASPSTNRSFMSEENRTFWTDLTPENFTPPHMVRAMLEELSETLYQSFLSIGHVANTSFGRLVGSGNGLRKNPALRRIMQDRFGMPLILPADNEEAARGAALMAAFGVGANADLFSTEKIVGIDMPESWKGPVGNTMYKKRRHEERHS